MIKIFEFLAKNIYMVSIGLMVFYYKQKPWIEVLTELYQLLLILMSIAFVLAGFWNIMVKKSFSEKSIKKTKYLQDYIFVLNNILLIRKMKIERSSTRENIENNFVVV